MRAAAFAARENASPGGGLDDAGSIEGEDPRASDEGRRRAGETVRIFRSGRSRAKTREDAASGWRRVAAAALDGDLARAEARLAEIVARDSRDVAAYLALGRVARERGDAARAVAIHQSLVLRPDLAPDERTRALLGLAASFGAAGDRRRAIAAYEEALLRARDEAGAWRELAALLEADGEPARALEALRRAERAGGPGEPAAASRLLARLAESRLAHRELRAARQRARQALQRDPASPDAHAVAGAVEAERGRLEAALRHWLAAARGDRARASELYARAERAHRELGRQEAWLDWLRGRVTEEPDDAAAWLALARALEDTVDPGAAVAEIRRLARGRPHALAALVALGRAALHAAHQSPERAGLEAAKAHAELLDELEQRLGARAAEAGGPR